MRPAVSLVCSSDHLATGLEKSERGRPGDRASVNYPSPDHAFYILKFYLVLKLESCFSRIYRHAIFRNIPSRREVNEAIMRWTNRLLAPACPTSGSFCSSAASLTDFDSHQNHLSRRHTQIEWPRKAHHVYRCTTNGSEVKMQETYPKPYFGVAGETWTQICCCSGLGHGRNGGCV